MNAHLCLGPELSRVDAAGESLGDEEVGDH